VASLVGNRLRSARCGANASDVDVKLEERHTHTVWFTLGWCVWLRWTGFHHRHVPIRLVGM